MTPTKVFAPNWEKNEFGYFVWPDDNDLRKSLYPDRVSHPAKNNLYLYRELIKYLTNEGDIILDPMLGAGSAMIGATIGRKVIGIELNSKLAEQAQLNAIHLMSEYPESIILVTEGDCTKLLPVGILADLVIFSPPYANQLHFNPNDKFVTDKDRFTDGIFEQGVDTYTEHPDSFANMPEFMFRNNMKKVYELCFKNTKPGGYMAIIIKDKISKGEREELGLWCARTAIMAGWEVSDWFRSEHIGKLWGNFNLKRGIRQITDEHNIIFRKPLSV